MNRALEHFGIVLTLDEIALHLYGCDMRGHLDGCLLCDKGIVHVNARGRESWIGMLW